MFYWGADVPDPGSEQTFALARIDPTAAEREPHRSTLAMHVELLRLRREVGPIRADATQRVTRHDSLVVVESRASALAPVPAGANDLLWPIRDGLITEGHVHAELGELVLGTRPGRADPAQLTLYKSVGVAAEDLAAASLLVATARERGVGRDVEL